MTGFDSIPELNRALMSQAIDRGEVAAKADIDMACQIMRLHDLTPYSHPMQALRQ